MDSTLLLVEEILHEHWLCILKATYHESEYLCCCSVEFVPTLCKPINLFGFRIISKCELISQIILSEHVKRNVMLIPKKYIAQLIMCKK